MDFQWLTLVWMKNPQSHGRNHGIRRPCIGVGLDGALLVGTSLLLGWPKLTLIVSMGRAFTSPKQTPLPPFPPPTTSTSTSTTTTKTTSYLKALGLDSAGSSLVLLFLLADGLLLLLWLLLLLLSAWYRLRRCFASALEPTRQRLPCS